MAKMKAQHATAGKYHLDTNYDFVSSKWDWWAKGIKPNSLTEFAGSASTLENAKRDACSSIGIVVPLTTWEEFGPDLDIPD